MCHFFPLRSPRGSTIFGSDKDTASIILNPVADSDHHQNIIFKSDKSNFPWKFQPNPPITFLCNPANKHTNRQLNAGYHNVITSLAEVIMQLSYGEIAYRSALTERTTGCDDVVSRTVSESTWSMDVTRLSMVSHLTGRACMCCSSQAFTRGIRELWTHSKHHAMSFDLQQRTKILTLLLCVETKDQTAVWTLGKCPARWRVLCLATVGRYPKTCAKSGPTWVKNKPELPWDKSTVLCWTEHWYFTAFWPTHSLFIFAL